MVEKMIRPIRDIRITFPDLDLPLNRQKYHIETDQKDKYLMEEGDSLVIRSLPEYELVLVLEMRSKLCELNTTVLRPESFKDWIKAYWKWYRGK